MPLKKRARSVAPSRLLRSESDVADVADVGRQISRTFVGCARWNDPFLLGAFVFPPRSERYEIVAN